MHLAIATRADPPLPLSRLRGRGAMTEIRIEDLRFTPGEAGTFLRQVMGLDLSEENVVRLEARTEGWIAGLQLAALALQGLAQKGRGEARGGEASGFVAAFAGDDRYVADYLIEEVLQHQPEPVQSFLLQTAILDRLSGPLCDAVLGGDSGQPSTSRDSSAPDHDPLSANYSQSMLEKLERGNLFLLPLDQKRHWYRYHRLFADLLRRRLQQMPTLAAREPDLHLRASAWFEQNGYTADAIGHALAAQDFERAAHLLEPATWTIISQGEITTLRGWLEALPEAIIRSRPRLGLIHAWTLIAAMDLEAVEPRLRAVEQRLVTAGDATGGEPDPEGLLGEVVAIRASVASLRGDVTTTLELSREALARLPQENLRLRGLLANTLGSGYDSLGEVRQASEAFAQSAALSQAVGNTLIALIALGNLARVQEIGGQLRQAAATCRRALRLSAEQGRMPPAAGVAYVGLGRLLYEWDDLDAAMEHITKGIDMGRRVGIAELVAAGCAGLARVHQARGEQAAALGAIEEALQLAQGRNVSAGLLIQISTVQAQLWIAQGNLEATVRWVRERGLSVDDDDAAVDGVPSAVPAPSYARQAEYVVLARLLIAWAFSSGHTAGRAVLPDRAKGLARAHRLLEQLVEAAKAQGRAGQVIEFLVLQALAFQAQGDTAQATRVLAQALALAGPEGYARMFLDEGEPMERLLQAYVLRHVDQHRFAPSDEPDTAGFGRKLLAAMGNAVEDEQPRTEKRPQELAISTLLEPLSEREVEVLQLAGAGLSNREIAEELFLTVGTVKWHLHNIYGKLQVSNRTRAVARARELGIL
jgi:LuxR family maltose regulon positive regulatory protein